MSAPSPVVGRAGPGAIRARACTTHRDGRRPTTALIATHYNVDFSEHYLAELLAERGYGFLGWNTRFRGAEPYFLLDHALAEIAVGVRWLREQGVERVVLLGNSGGGSLMSAYHSQCRRGDDPPGVGPRAAAGGRTTSRRPTCSCSSPPTPGDPEILTDWLDPALRSTSSTRSAATRRSTCTTRPTGRRTTPSSSSATGPPRSPATTASPTGASTRSPGSRRTG